MGELLELSMLSESTFFDGLRKARELGLVHKRGNNYEAIIIRPDQNEQP
jgi:hypothetical protein